MPKVPKYLGPYLSVRVCQASCLNLKYATEPARTSTIVSSGSILYSFFSAWLIMPAVIIAQKQTAATGVSTGIIPVSHGTIMPIHPSHSSIPSIRIGIIDAFGFICPSAICCSLLPVIFPKPGITKKAASKAWIIQSVVFIPAV